MAMTSWGEPPLGATPWSSPSGVADLSPGNRWWRWQEGPVAQQVARGGDRLMVLLLGAHALAATLGAWWSGQWGLGLGVGWSGAALFAWLVGRQPGAVVNRIASGTLLMTYSALFIQLGQGALELHFHVFAAAALLLVYRDWRPLVVGAAVIAVHHLAFGYFQAAGWGVVAFPEARGSLPYVLVHAAFVVFEVTMLATLAVMMRRDLLQADALSEAMDRGHLDHRVQTDGSGALGLLAEAFNRFLGHTQGLVGGVGQSTGVLLRSAEAVGSAASALEASGARQVGRIQETEGELAQAKHHAEAVAHHVRSLSSDSAQTAQGIAVVAGALHQVGGLANKAAQAITQASEQASSGEEAATTAKRRSLKTEEAIRGLAAAVEAFQARAEAIAGALDVMADLSDQTNMLALNAAIEAARAGEAGRGFAVVANEVRALSDRSAASAASIAKEVQGLRRDADGASQAASAALGALGEGTMATEQASGLLLGISKSIAGLDAEMAELARATQHQVAAAASVREAAQRMDGQVQALQGLSEAQKQSAHKQEQALRAVLQEAKANLDAAGALALHATSLHHQSDALAKSSQAFGSSHA